MSGHQNVIQRLCYERLFTVCNAAKITLHDLHVQWVVEGEVHPDSCTGTSERCLAPNFPSMKWCVLIPPDTHFIIGWTQQRANLVYLMDQ